MNTQINLTADDDLIELENICVNYRQFRSEVGNFFDTTIDGIRPLIYNMSDFLNRKWGAANAVSEAIDVAIFRAQDRNMKYFRYEFRRIVATSMIPPLHYSQEDYPNTWSYYIQTIRGRHISVYVTLDYKLWQDMDCLEKTISLLNTNKSVAVDGQWLLRTRQWHDQIKQFIIDDSNKGEVDEAD